MNAELAQEALDYIKAHPEEHSQAVWAKRVDCQTFMCYAGTVAFLSGAEFVFEENDDYELATRIDGTVEDGVIVKRGEETLGIWDAARLLLGINRNQAARLFIDADTYEDLRETVERYIAADALV